MKSSCSKSNSTKESSQHSLESALERLESIVADIEANPPPLETLIERYEEGTRLLKICRDKLTAAERRIEIISRNAQGEATLQPFDHD
ncbi:MAG: exodeoxyribonuclease VII small subunit [Verrucomicrobia bacterium]|nr:exodeoxyribonuclease VII small subunit [Verrucomicrobiota bacterium]